MRWLEGLLLGLLFVIGALIGVVLGVLALVYSLWTARRVVHAEGVLCRAEITSSDDEDHFGSKLVGTALVRLSGAFADQTTKGTDVLGFAIRLQREAVPDVRVGDQDLVFGTFNSFRTAAKDRAATDAGDYLGNTYHSVTPWWVPEVGPAKLTLLPPQAAPRDRAPDRLSRLDVDIEMKRARFTLNAGVREIAAIKLVEQLADDGSAFRVSMFRCGRGIRPVGFRNGLRATIYPLGQFGRRLRGR